MGMVSLRNGSVEGAAACLSGCLIGEASLSMFVSITQQTKTIQHMHIPKNTRRSFSS
jgi:hypothetical protein